MKNGKVKPTKFSQAKNSSTVRTSLLCMMEITTCKDVLTNYKKYENGPNVRKFFFSQRVVDIANAAVKYCHITFVRYCYDIAK